MTLDSHNAFVPDVVKFVFSSRGSTEAIHEGSLSRLVSGTPLQSMHSKQGPRSDRSSLMYFAFPLPPRRSLSRLLPPVAVIGISVLSQRGTLENRG